MANVRGSGDDRTRGRKFGTTPLVSAEEMVVGNIAGPVVSFRVAADRGRLVTDGTPRS